MPSTGRASPRPRGAAQPSRRCCSGPPCCWAGVPISTGAGELSDADPCVVADLAVRGGARRFLDACRAAAAPEDAQRSAARALRVLIDEEAVVVPVAGTYRVWGLRREVRGFVPHPSSASQRWDRVSLATSRVSR